MPTVEMESSGYDMRPFREARVIGFDEWSDGYCKEWRQTQPETEQWVMWAYAFRSQTEPERCNLKWKALYRLPGRLMPSGEGEIETQYFHSTAELEAWAAQNHVTFDGWRPLTEILAEPAAMAA